MNYLSRGLQALSGATPQQQNPSETIDKLCDRVRNSTLLEDRRSSVLALKGLARDWKLEVGSKALLALIHVLSQDRLDVEMTRAVLETLKMLCYPDEPGSPTKTKDHQDYGIQFTDIFVKDPANVTLLLTILEDYDFYVRYDALQLLSILLQNKPQQVQDCVLTSPMGVSKLMDLLGETREAVRSEALLLLISLTQSNADIQKIIAFENAFERLLELISDENIEPITVQDCLQLMLNLLCYNVSNQNYFRETSCIARLPHLLYTYLPRQDQHQYEQEVLKPRWDHQKSINCCMVLEVVRSLVVPGSGGTVGNQNAMNQAKLLSPVLELAIADDVPLRVKAQALFALAEIIRSNRLNQDIFNQATVYIPIPIPNVNPESEIRYTEIQRSALLAVVSIAVGGPIQQQQKQLPTQQHDAMPNQSPRGERSEQGNLKTIDAFVTRAAAAYVVQCYICNNPDGKLSLAMAIMNPPPDEVADAPVDQPFASSIVLTSLLDWKLSTNDPYRAWFASTILSNVLDEADKCKEIVMGMYRQQILSGRASKKSSDDDDDDDATLVQTIGHSLYFSGKENVDVRISIALLSLLCTWLWDCPTAVKEFLNDNVAFSYVIEQINQSSNIDTLVQGLAAFLLGTCYLYHEDEQECEVTRTMLHQIIANRIHTDQLINRVTRLREDKRFINAGSLCEIADELDSKDLPLLYFDLGFVDFVKENYSQIQKSISLSPQQLSRKSAVKREATSTDGNRHDDSTISSYKDRIEKQDKEIHTLRGRVKELESQLDGVTKSYESKIATLTSHITQLQNQLTGANARFEEMSKEQEDVLVCLAEQDMEIDKMRKRLKELGDEGWDEEDGGGTESENESAYGGGSDAGSRNGSPTRIGRGGGSPRQVPVQIGTETGQQPRIPLSRSRSQSPTKQAIDVNPAPMPTQLFGELNAPSFPDLPPTSSTLVAPNPFDQTQTSPTKTSLPSSAPQPASSSKAQDSQQVLASISAVPKPVSVPALSQSISPVLSPQKPHAPIQSGTANPQSLAEVSHAQSNQEMKLTGTMPNSGVATGVGFGSVASPKMNSPALFDDNDTYI